MSGYHFQDEQKVKDRIACLIELAEYLIESQELKEYIQVSDDLLSYAVLDYFTDIERLKQFHNIEKTQPVKVGAYTAYWISRRKPLQIIKNLGDNFLDDNKSPLWINEWFALNVLFSFSYNTEVMLNCLIEEEKKYNEFLDVLHYNLCYRQFTPQSLELTLLALSCIPDNPSQ